MQLIHIINLLAINQIHSKLTQNGRKWKINLLAAIEWHIIILSLAGPTLRK
jgi:hypothetical protein